MESKERRDGVAHLGKLSSRAPLELEIVREGLEPSALANRQGAWNRRVKVGPPATGEAARDDSLGWQERIKAVHPAEGIALTVPEERVAFDGSRLVLARDVILDALGWTVERAETPDLVLRRLREEKVPL